MTVYFRNMKETELNNELSTKFVNIALDITPKSIFYTQCCFFQVDGTNLSEIQGFESEALNTLLRYSYLIS